jgi:glycosyltransferase involved in cell wall biosynthesis
VPPGDTGIFRKAQVGKDNEESMKKRNDRRIAIFQVEYPVTFQTANCAIMLAEAGYDVDLFCFNISKEDRFVEFEKLTEWSRVRIYDFTPDGPPTSSSDNDNKVAGKRAFRQGVKTFLRTTIPPLVTIHSYIRSALWKARYASGLVDGLEKGLLPQEIVSQALERMAGKHYRCLIGIEKEGLIWAGQISKKLQVPLIYYSTELYTDDYKRVMGGWSWDFERLRLAERRYHRRACATIIQDPERARVLFQDNGLSMSKASVYYVPVSLMGGPYQKRSWFLHEALGIPKARKVILHFGAIWEGRYVVELTQVAQTLPDDWIVVMHGWVVGSAVEKIKTLDRRNRVILSLKMVPSDRIREIVASADIGLALYSRLTENERLTAFSSEKMALYMQCGIPFIAFDYPGYRDLATKDCCGVVIRSLEELPEAAYKILVSHEEFRRHAYQAFCKHYDFARNFGQVIEGVGRL